MTGFTKFADGYCQDWAYPNDSGYDTVSTTAAKCMERCRSKYPGTTSFYLKGTKCGCAKSTTSGRCAVTASAGYTAYEISGVPLTPLYREKRVGTTESEGVPGESGPRDLVVW